MTQPTNAAKAASLLHHTWGVNCGDEYDKALTIYHQLQDADHASYVDILEEHDAGIWAPIETMHMIDWWENVECLARSIDEARKHFGETP